MNGPAAPIAFELQVAGKDVFPETLALDDLADILKGMESSVVAMAGVQDAGVDSKRLGLALVNIGRGSANLAFASLEPQIARRAFTSCSNAIRTGRIAELPPDARAGIGDLAKVARKRNVVLRLVPRPGDAADSEIRPDSTIPSPGTIEGDTVLYGLVERIGGAGAPKLMLRLDGRGRLLSCDLADKEQARAVAQHLYDTVAASGRATWNAITWEIESFKVSSLRVHHKVSPIEAFRVLAEACPGAWDGVEDVDGAIRELRG
jgi:hypothetical protein